MPLDNGVSGLPQQICFFLTDTKDLHNHFYFCFQRWKMHFTHSLRKTWWIKNISQFNRATEIKKVANPRQISGKITVPLLSNVGR